MTQPNKKIFCSIYNDTINNAVSDWYLLNVEGNSSILILDDFSRRKELKTDYNYCLVPDSLFSRYDLDTKVLEVLMHSYNHLKPSGKILFDIKKPNIFQKITFFKDFKHTILDMKGGLYQAGFSNVEIIESPNAEISNFKSPCYLVIGTK